MSDYRLNLTIDRHGGCRCWLSGLLLTAGLASAEPDYFDLSLEQLQAIPVTTASRLPERAQDAPVAISSLQRSEILRSGASSIEEALRLVPGVIVREKTRGGYEVHLRGFNNIPNNTFPGIGDNTTTLVMIDNQPVYNYYLGGVNWQALPVDINDVERIEVVRGTASAQYGPNAASGVIHIITRQPADQPFAVSGSVQVSNDGSQHGHVLLSGSQDGWQYGFSANSHDLERSQRSVYEYNRQRYVAVDDLRSLSGVELSQVLAADPPFPDPDQANDSHYYRVKLGYERDDLRLSASYADSHAEYLATFFDNFYTPLNHIETRADYLAVTAGWRWLQYSRFESTGDLDRAGSASIDHRWDWQIDRLELSEAFGPVTLQLLTEETALDYRGRLVGDRRVSIDSTALSGRADIRLHAQWRAIAAWRRDDYELAYDRQDSRQYTLMFTPDSRHTFWLMQGEAFRTPFAVDTFADVITEPEVGDIATRFISNPDLDLMNITEWQFGWRGNLSAAVSVTTELYQRKARDFSTFVALGPPVNNLIESQSRNSPVRARQQGAIVQLNWQLDDNWYLTTHLSWQQTRLEDQQNGLPDGEFDGTPRWLGGATVNYRYSERTNLNLALYGFDQARIDTASTDAEIAGKVLVDLTWMQRINDWLDLRTGVRNLLNQDAVEYNFTDAVDRSVFAELRLTY